MQRRRDTDIASASELREEEGKGSARYRRHSNMIPNSMGRLRERLDVSSFFNKENGSSNGKTVDTDLHAPSCDNNKKHSLWKRGLERTNPVNFIDSSQLNDNETIPKSIPLIESFNNFQLALTELKQKTLIRKSNKDQADRTIDCFEVGVHCEESHHSLSDSSTNAADTKISETIKKKEQNTFTVHNQHNIRPTQNVNSTSRNTFFKRPQKLSVSDREVQNHDETPPCSYRQHAFQGLSSVPFFGVKLGTNFPLFQNTDISDNNGNNGNNTTRSLKESQFPESRKILKKNVARFRMLSVRKENATSKNLELRRTKSATSVENHTGTSWVVNEKQQKIDEDYFTSEFKLLTQLRDMRRALVFAEQSLKKLSEQSKRNRILYEMEIERLQALFSSLDKVQEARHKKTLEVLNSNYQALDFLERKFGYLISAIGRSGRSNIQEAFNRLSQIVFRSMMSTAFKIVQLATNCYYRRQRANRVNVRAVKNTKRED